MGICFQKWVRFGVPALVLTGVAVAASGLWSCSRSSDSGRVEAITIGTMANAGDTLLFAADAQKYFTGNGLDVALKTYDSGLAATDAMIRGEVNLAYATEFVVVGKALQLEAVSIITAYSLNETVSLAGRKDRGIVDVLTLKGKKIGLARGTINEFYLGRLLGLNGLDMGDVTLVNVKLTDLPDALRSGKVDAVVAGSRNLYPIIQQQEHNLFVRPAHNRQPAYGTLVGKNDWVAGHPELVKRLLQSLTLAEQYVNRNPDAAKALVQKRLGYDDDYMAHVWSEYQFRLLLDQALILAMEDETRWMIKNNLTSAKQMPDFLDYIYEDALKAINPGAVNIIR